MRRKLAAKDDIVPTDYMLIRDIGTVARANSLNKGGIAYKVTKNVIALVYKKQKVSSTCVKTKQKKK